MTTPERVDREPIAIIGMSCRLPGANDPDALWKMVAERKEGVAEYPGGRTPDLDAFYRRAGMPDGPVSSRGGFLPDIDKFDAAFFEISPREAEWLDPQQRLLLEAGWEALEDAGIPLEALPNEQTGVFAGVWVNEYERHAAASAPVAEFFLITGGPLYGASSRLAYQFDLRGPDISVNAACGSSLVAIHLAVRSLRSGECSVALAGGVNVLVRHELTQAYSRSQMLSPDGRCKFGDATADGFVRSDGAGMLVLKRLSDARRDGNRILAVIRGTAMANDGRGSGLLATPSAAGQRHAMLDALADAGLAPHDLDYVEAHGTGTRAGDPIEISAIASVFGRAGNGSQPCRIGSLKSNIGHTESAAGVASIIRTVQALRHRKFPATLHVNEPNPAIDWEAAGVMLERAGAAWDKTDGMPRRASVNGLGLTGTNAHVILEEAPPAEEAGREFRSAYTLPLSAASASALTQRAKDIVKTLDGLREPEDNLTDLCYTAAVRRTHLSHRLAVSGTGIAELRSRLEEFAEGRDSAFVPSGAVRQGRKPKIAFVFPGQGAQWVGMGRELLRGNAAFRRSMEEIDAAIQRETGWSVIQQLEDAAQEQLTRIDIVQPTLFAVEVALAEVWQSWGVVAEAVIGHSMGEIAAACVAGILSLEDATRVICRRSALLTRVAGRGAMVVVDLPRAEAERLTIDLEDKVSVAVSNSPRSTVLAGDPATLDGIVERLEQRDVFCRWVRVDVASHSPQMDPLTKDLFAALAEVRPQSGAVPMCSTVRVGMIDPGQMNSAYWVENLRQPVLFASAIEELLKRGFDTFVEMSPHPLLVPFVEQTAAQSGHEVLALGSLRREEPETAALFTSLGRLYAAGADVAWQRIYAAGNLVKLPAYPWQRERFWMESSGAAAGFRNETGHPLAGEPLQAATGEWIWTAKLTASEHPWLKDHAVGGTALLPASAYVELAGAVAKQVLGDAAIVENLGFTEAAAFHPEMTLQLQIFAVQEFQDAFSVKFFRRANDADAWMQTAECTLRHIIQEKAPRADLRKWEDAEFSPGTSSGTQHAEKMAEHGYDFGPFFSRVEWLALEAEDALSRIGVPDELRREKYLLHPAALDGALQVLARLLLERSGKPQTLLPVAFAKVEFQNLPLREDALYVQAIAAPEALTGDVSIFDTDGRLLVAIQGLAFRALEPTPESISESLYEIKWEKLNADDDRETSPGHWLLIGDRSDLAIDLAQSMRHRGASTDIVPPPEFLRGAIEGRDAIRGVVWLTPLAVDRNSTLADAQQVLADGAGVVSRLAGSGSEGSVPVRMWMVTRGAQSVNGEPIGNVLAAGAWGFFASAGNEYPGLQASCVDLPATSIEGEPDLLASLLLGNGPEDRIALRENGRFAARLGRFESSVPRAAEIPVGSLRESECFELHQPFPGSLDRFELVSGWAEAPHEGEVEICVEASGLNFKDVLRAMAVHQELAGLHLGGECAGRVVRVGSGVTGFQPGDAVLAISPSFQTVSMFASRVRVPEALVAKKPKSMSFAQAAGVPCVFLTAWYGLIKLARLQKGERVLIHAAAGGVGLAAIQIAQWIGAEIYATVGSGEKREYLRSLGVNQVMHSRKLDFTREVLAATQGKGVDVVLNSLAGPAIASGLDALAPYGRFVEIGRRDILANSRIGLRPFEKNLSMFSVDLAQSVEDRRAMVGAMLAEVMELFRQGVFAPLPITLFPVSAADNAFQFMAKGEHIGKIVLNVQDEAAMVRRDASRLASHATYLITGGLGALGLVTAQVLVDHGATHLVLTSRHLPSEDILPALREMEASGATMTIRHADVASETEVRTLLNEIRETMPPLRGIVHAAGVLDDAVVAHLSAERFGSVMAGKVSGALALDANVNAGELDFLVYYSSVAGVLGNPGQANYAAANAVLDAVAHSQRARGIPAISIDWGTWGTVGLAAAAENRAARLASQGLKPLSRAEGAALVACILEAAPTQVMAMHLDANQWCASHPAAAQSRLLSNLLRQGATVASEGADFAASLALLDGEERRDALTMWLRQQVAAVLRLDAERIPVDKTLRSLGLDSLMALELRNRLERHLGLKLSATLVWNYPTVSAVAALLEGRFSAKHQEEVEAERNSVSTPGAKTLPILQHESGGRSAAELLEMELLGAESLLRN
jgi:acyl transferase domain-containing protein/NADPH:quinone reductase-like Zn-dependent oxidoreductase/NAD(P)-dependent dehydrogenase (short-subunit alcohol dehydrogenase family)/acyl carrier protein